MRITLFLALALAACSPTAPPHRADGTAAKRIVSLLPSFTEDLCAIGSGKQLVGVSRFSENTCARKVPIVNDASSIDSERIIALRPDLVIGIPSQRIMVLPLQRAGLHVVLYPDDSYNDLMSDIGRLGQMSGHASQANALDNSLISQTHRLEDSEHFRRRPSVFVVVQTAPVWTVGPQSYISTLIRLAGGRNAVASLPQAYAQFSPEALLRLQPDALLASRDAQLTAVLDREPWRSLRAVREHHVFITGDSSALYRPGPNYNRAVAWLIERLRPIAR